MFLCTYQWYQDERIHKPVPTARNMHILFHEQAVCGRRYKNQKKAYLMRDIKITLLMLGRGQDSSLFKELKQKRSKMGFWSVT